MCNWLVVGVVVVVLVLCNWFVWWFCSSCCCFGFRGVEFAVFSCICVVLFLMSSPYLTYRRAYK